MRRFKRGDFVVHRGRVGCINWTYLETGTAQVQFGADGPIEDHQFTALRWATEREMLDRFGTRHPFVAPSRKKA